MGGWIAFGLAVGAGIQAWRQWPADGPTTTSSGVLIMIAGMIAAYLAGRWRGRGTNSATAHATATAVASAASVGNTVNLFVATPGGGVTPASTLAGVPSDSAPWLTGTAVPALDVALLEGMDDTDLEDLDVDLDVHHVSD